LAVAQSAERAKKLREKFEKWEQNEIKKEMNGKSIVMNTDADNDDGQWETAKRLIDNFLEFFIFLMKLSILV
jgi:outer membrane protein assembly factor BamD (BamD/ComL family)